MKMQKKNYKKCGVSSSTHTDSTTINRGDYGVTANTGDGGEAANNADYGISAHTGHKGTSVSGEIYVSERSIAANTGASGHAANYSYYGVAACTRGYSIADSTGDSSIAANSGNYSIADSTGDSSIAANSGNYGAASVGGKKSVAVAIGRDCWVRGALGCFLVCAEWAKDERDGEWHPVACIAAHVDGNKIKPDTWYKVSGGKFVEVDDDESKIEED